MNKDKKVVITYGTFDLFHHGHLNILKRAKEYGNYLIVGVTSEDYDRSRGKLNVVQSLEHRYEVIKSLSFIDKVIIEYHKNQKIEDIQKYNVSTFVIGDDWEGKFDYLKDHCKVIYLPRTRNISSSLIREDIEVIKLGIIGTGRIAKRFAKECSQVDGIEIHSVMSTNIDNVYNFIKEHGILYGFDNIDDFLDSDIDAIYIASPHETHYDYSKKALLVNKHVLCEKPVTLNNNELQELIVIAKNSNLIFIEAIKTAYLPAFTRMIDEINNGIIGEVFEVRSTFTKLIDDRNLREWKLPYGGATNELSSYPLLIANKVLGNFKKTTYHPIIKNNIDIGNTIISEHENGMLSISTVGIGIKSEGCAVISGTKGYVYIPAPWWLTKKFMARFEDPNKELIFDYHYEGDGLKHEISEFISLIRRKEIYSKRLSHENMLQINSVISSFKI